MAQGVAHQHNALKLRLLDAFFKNGLDKPMTCRQIEDITGVERKRIASAMDKYRRSPRCCFRRMRKRAKGNKSWVYKINRHGIVRYYEYLRRAKLGYDLNLRHKNPGKMPHFTGIRTIDMEQAVREGLHDEEIINYITLTKQGMVEMGLLEDKEKLLRNSGLFRDYFSSIEKPEDCEAI